MDEKNDRNVIEILRREHEDVFSRHNCPAHLQEALERYVAHGLGPGDCLGAVLANDLMEAFKRADVETARRMAAIVSYVYHCVPRAAWGSYDAVDAWIAAHREQRAQKRREEGGGGNE